MTRRQLQPCGTDAAYRRHLRKGETACKPCRQAHSRSITEWRRAPWKPREVQPCPSDAAYRRHLSRGEKPCFGCRVAHAEAVAAWMRAKRAAA